MALNNLLNAPFPLSATLGGSGVASPTIHGILVAQGASAFATKVLTDGQLLIGSTGVDPVGATLTAGSNITITNGAGSITIAATGSASFSWNNASGTTQAMVANNGYYCTNAGLTTLTLPVTAAAGTVIRVVGNGAGGWIIAQNSSQLINVGNTASTTGVGGSVASGNRYDTIELLCVVADTQWNVLSGVTQQYTIV